MSGPNVIPPLSALDDLRLLFESLKTRALKPGRPPVDGYGEAAKFVEALEAALLKCGLLAKESDPRSWHSSKELKDYLGSAAFGQTSTIYGYRNDGWHENTVQERSLRALKGCLDAFEEEISNVVRMLRSRGEDLVNAIFDVQESDVSQVVGRNLVEALLGVSGVELAALADLALSKALLDPARTTRIRTHPDPMRRLRSTVRHVAAQGPRPRTLVLLATSMSEELGDAAARQLAPWFATAHDRLELRSEVAQAQPRAVRVELEVAPSRQIRIENVSLRPVEQRLPDDLQAQLGLPRLVDEEQVSSVVGEAVNGLLWAMAVPLRRLHLVLQFAVPPELTYLDLDRTLTRNFRCVAVAPRVSGRMARALEGPIAHPGRRTGNSLQVDDSLSVEELLDRLRDHGAIGVDVDCVFAAPALVRPDHPRAGELCPAVEAFTEHVLAVHFHSAGVRRQVLELFGENDVVELEELFDQVRTLSRGSRLTLLWDDSRYHQQFLETLR